MFELNSIVGVRAMAMPLETRISAREGSWQQYNWVRESDVMVPMRDGVRLADVNK